MDGSLPAGMLADVAPTVLDLFGLDKPEEMTGYSLLERGSDSAGGFAGGDFGMSDSVTDEAASGARKRPRPATAQ
ncbi:MAG: hypothetical protein WKG07_13165 [Hymenobacter sp.]